jgi:hypothetical protein
MTQSRNSAILSPWCVGFAFFLFLILLSYFIVIIVCKKELFKEIDGSISESALGLKGKPRGESANPNVRGLIASRLLLSDFSVGEGHKLKANTILHLVGTRRKDWVSWVVSTKRWVVRARL